MIYFSCTILNTKIKLIAPLDSRIKAAQIEIQIVVILTRLWYKLIRWFSFLLPFYIISKYFSWNKFFNINSISYLRQSEDVLITKVTHLWVPSLNRNKNNRVDSLVIWGSVKEIACCMNEILIIYNIGYFKEFSLMANFWNYVNLLKEYFYFFFGNKNCTHVVMSG